MGLPLSPGKNQPQHDLVYTPVNLAKDIISRFPITGRVLEPCRGKGAFYDNLPDHVEKFWCELDEGKDFFDFNEKVDWIITNPPWSKFREFLEHSVSIADNIVFLVTVNHFMTKARMRILKHNNFGFQEIYCVSTPKENWPASGFQLAAIHIQKNATDKLFTGISG